MVAISQEGRLESGKTRDKSTGQAMSLTEREFQKMPDWGLLSQSLRGP